MCAQAYLGKLMADLRVRKVDDLANCEQPFDDKDNYRKVMRFGDETLRDTLEGYITHIRQRNEEARLSKLYTAALQRMNAATTEAAWKTVAEDFRNISGFKDADSLAEQCLEKAAACRKDAIYAAAKATMAGDQLVSYEAAIESLQTIPDWKDASKLIGICEDRIEQIKAKEEADRIAAEYKAEERRIAAAKRVRKAKKIAAIATPIACVCIACVIVLTTVIIPKQKYNKVVAEYGQEYADAFYVLYTLEVGDVCEFGSYEQDNNASNGKEAIKWTVLDKNGMSLLLISNYALDCQQYNTSYADVTWKNCSLRAWLNNTFFDAAFSPEEQALIQSTTVSVDENPSYNANPSNETIDKIFLLSISEAKRYFSSDEERKCVPTAYAKAHGAYASTDHTTVSGEETCRWWLRTLRRQQIKAANVYSDGSVNYNGTYVLGDCVRPAMWVKLLG